MSSIWLDILLLFLLVLANGWFAMVEIAVVSARKAKLQVLARKGNARAQEALALLTQPSRFLATVQIGISLVGVFAGAFGGATIAEKLAVYFRSVPLLAEYSELLGLIVVVAGITYLSLVVGELVPKHVALRNPERVTLLFVRPLRWLLLLSYPAVRFLSASSDGIMKMMRL
ncbi:MAG: CNNM domain-containing protein [bacterium]|nr:CNNM domain-containing protein [bacterium]